jgi:hypothetical protein
MPSRLVDRKSPSLTGFFLEQSRELSVLRFCSFLPSRQESPSRQIGRHLHLVMGPIGVKKEGPGENTLIHFKPGPLG